MKQDTSLEDRLYDYAASDYYPFHMPGHKRREHMKDPFLADITEIDGFDDLLHAHGILKEAQKRAARLYNARETFFLTGGSTTGILSGISAAAEEKRQPVLIARNCHKSVYHAIYLNQLEPVYLYPQRYPETDGDGNRFCVPGYIPGLNGRIRPEDVEKELNDHPGIRLCCLTSPTYDGVISDIRTIADICHGHDCLLMVDEAHGAHFGLHPAFPASAINLGADLVVQSLHKTMPALTQASLLHVGGDRISSGRVMRMIGIYQTSSPSYVILASMDACIRKMEQEGSELFDRFAARLADFKRSVSDLNALQAFSTDDPSRIIIRDRREDGLSGRQICDILRRKYHLELEMETPFYAVALTSVFDTREGFDRLAKALHAIDLRIVMHPDTVEAMDLSGQPGGRMKRWTGSCDVMPEAQSMQPLWKMWDQPSVPVRLEESTGMICSEFVYLYPPGIPILAPGELISLQVLEYLISCREAGFALRGMKDETGTFIQVGLQNEF